MRETKIKMKLRGWRSDGLVFEPQDANMHGMVEAIKRGDHIIMEVEKGYERSEQDIQNNGARSTPMDTYARHKVWTANGLHPDGGSR